MQEITERVESIEEFREWLYKTLLPEGDFSIIQKMGIFEIMPDTAKLALIQEWLESKKNIIIESQYEQGSDSYDWFLRGDKVDGGFDYNEDFETRNEALSKGIEEALNILNL